MHIHPAIKTAGHLGLIGSLMQYFGWFAFIFEKIESLYERTAWIRDLVGWAKKKVGMKHKAKKRGKKRK